MSCVEEQEQNQSHTKSGERDRNGLVMCYTCHQQHYHELPSGGHLIAAGRETDRTKHGGGQWRKRSHILPWFYDSLVPLNLCKSRERCHVGYLFR